MVAALEAGGIPYALCGGLAMSIHANPRTTDDIDLLVLEKDIEPIKVALTPLGFEELAFPMDFGHIRIRRLTKIEKNGRDTLVLDLLLASGVVPEAAWNTRIRAAWADGQISAVSREGLIALKRQRSSDRDLLDIKDLDAHKDSP